MELTMIGLTLGCICGLAGSRLKSQGAKEFTGELRLIGCSAFFSALLLQIYLQRQGFGIEASSLLNIGLMLGAGVVLSIQFFRIVSEGSNRLLGGLFLILGLFLSALYILH